MPLHPISFSIPAELIVDRVPPKSQVVAKTYGFEAEAEYYKTYADAFFGPTSKKGGWDCLRHYEILANGCIPYFDKLDALPKYTMHDFPRELVTAGMQLSGARNISELLVQDMDHLPQGALTEVAEALLHHTRCKLTTHARASEIVRKVGLEMCDLASVLYVSADPSPDYLRCLTLHGFKTMLGPRCVDIVEVPHLYKDFPEADAAKLYGRGFTYTRKLDPVYRNATVEAEDVPGMIRDNAFDLIIYGSSHRGMPFFDVVKDAVPENRVALLCGEDDHTCNMHMYSQLCHVFVREM